ncbi:hypothetical protein [Yokenella regensburgei]|uniref:hypothetical protein n=1 Tax=Yokenella regensburgei TaxID=158877 RepID=UPI00137648F5|nr:hypothetical protein [Yokenella regensburgei]KAF1366775.1 hypothetical protein FHR25_004740 [Yokenella regensburgei]
MSNIDMSTITKEQVMALISEAEEWAEIYEHPIHDKPQRDFFEGMARALTAYLAVLTAEPAAWTDEVELEDMENTGRAYIFKSRRAMGTPEPGSVVKLYRLPLQEVKP